MPSVTCTGVTSNGRVIFQFGKRGREFADVQAAKEFVRSVLSPEVLEAILIAKALQANDPTVAIGKVATGDLTVANVVRVS